MDKQRIEVILTKTAILFPWTQQIESTKEKRGPKWGLLWQHPLLYCPNEDFPLLRLQRFSSFFFYYLFLIEEDTA